MAERLIQLPLHPFFPKARVVGAARKINLANPKQPEPVATQRPIPTPESLDLMHTFGALVGAQNGDGRVEWLNWDSTSRLFDAVPASQVVAFIIPLKPPQPSPAALRFLLGEVVPFILGIYTPPLREKAIVAEARGDPGWGRKPWRKLTPAEALLHVLWDTPALKKELGDLLQIAEFTDPIYSKLLGNMVVSHTIGNYRRTHERERALARQFGYAEIDDE